MNLIRFDAHAIPMMKFTSTLLFALSVRIGRSHGRRKVEHTGAQRLLMLSIGLLETSAYVCFCIGFVYCGAGTTAIVLSGASQTFTALGSRFVLKKRLSHQKLVAVLCVMTGVIMKALSEKDNVFAFKDGTHILGMISIMCAGLLYSSMGIAYETLLLTGTENSPPPTHPDIMLHSSIIGTVCGCVYQIVYVIPQWETLVVIPQRASGMSPILTVLLLMSFGVSYNIHMFAQSLVFRSDGALGVGLVNAVRGSMINLTASIVFCPLGMSQWRQCLSWLSMTSGVITTIGGILGVTDSPSSSKSNGTSGAHVQIQDKKGMTIGTNSTGPENKKEL